MTITRLTPEQAAQFDRKPEYSMGLQIAVRKDDQDQTTLILYGRIALMLDSELDADLRALRGHFAGAEQLSPHDYARELEGWTGRLDRDDQHFDPEALKSLQGRAAQSALQLVHLGPVATNAAPPMARTRPYGHLPFKGVCNGNDVFYRYEAYPNSRRINLATNRVARGTYAAPASEAPFTPTGLSAVGRFALPSLLPACWRYELRPGRNKPIRYGASVPLFGQSGGAVEVIFDQTFQNQGSIANPLILPIL